MDSHPLESLLPAVRWAVAIVYERILFRVFLNYLLLFFASVLQRINPSSPTVEGATTTIFLMVCGDVSWAPRTASR